MPQEGFTHSDGCCSLSPSFTRANVMNVLQVLTLVTPDGAYGGPARVAFNQASEIRAQGHSVTITGGCRGYPRPPDTLYGTSVRLFRARRVVPFAGAAGIAAPSAIYWIFKNRRNIDVVHVHLGRDLVSMPTALLALLLKKRLIVQTHGMIIKSKHLIAPALDRFVTRPILRRADVVLYLTARERDDLLEVETEIAVQALPNGVPPSPPLATPNDGVVEVLYLARLHERKRPALFVETAREILTEGIDARFTLVGPDGGEGSKVRDAISRGDDMAKSIKWEGSLPPEETADRMAQASIYVLPSVDEPFSMSVLEAMAIGLPVVITESCGLADTVRASGCGIVVDHSQKSLTGAVRRLIEDPALREEMGEAGRKTARENFSMDAIGRTLLTVYGLNEQ
jgi:glycosyltransferase involved in cell wall biosynthesis